MVKVIDQNNVTHDTKNVARPYNQELNVSVKGRDLNNKERSSSLKSEIEEHEENTFNQNNGNQNTSNTGVKEESIENKNGYISANNGADFATNKKVDLSLNVMPTRPGRINIALDMIRKSTEKYITEHGFRDLAVSLPNK